MAPLNRCNDRTGCYHCHLPVMCGTLSFPLPCPLTTCPPGSSVLCSAAVLDRAQLHPVSHLGNHGPRHQADSLQVSLFRGPFPFCISVEKGVVFISRCCQKESGNLFMLQSQKQELPPQQRELILSFRSESDLFIHRETGMLGII